MELIDCTLDQFIEDWPVSESLRATITEAFSDGNIPFETIGEYYKAGPSTQGEMRESFRLYGDLAYELQSLMDDAVEVYLNANPSIVNVVKESNKLDGELADNPGNLMEKEISEKDSYPKKEINLNDSLGELSISEFVRDKDISVRLRNALRDERFTVTTVREYVEAGPSAEGRLLKIRNMGRKTAREFQVLVDEAITTHDSYTKEEINLNDSLGELSLSEFVRDKDISVRLRNALRNKYNPFSTVREYVEAGPSAKERLLKIRNMGRKTAREFQALIVKEICFSDLDEKEKLNIDDFLGNLPLTEFLERQDTSVRLRNGIENACADGTFPFKTVREYIKAGRKAEVILLQNKNMGRKTVYELQHLIDRVIDDPSAFLNEGSLDLKGDSEGLGVREIIAKLSNSIGKKEFGILEARAVDGRTLQELGDIHGVSRERIRQLCDLKAVQKFKRLFPSAPRLIYGQIIEKIDERGGQFSYEEATVEFLCAINEIKIFAYLYEGSNNEILRKLGFEGDCIILKPGALHERDWRAKIKKELLLSNWPIHIKDILERTASIPPYYVTKCLEKNYKAKVRDGVIKKINLSVAAKYVFIFRKEKKPLHIRKIVKLFYEYFEESVSESRAIATLGRLKEVLIVDLGTYNIYENLRFSKTCISGIREKVHNYLTKENRFLGSRVIFDKIFNTCPKEWDPAFNSYMMLGIVQDDNRFLTKPGLMIGLRKFRGKALFISLEDEVIDMVFNNRPITLKAIFSSLSETRSLCNDTTVRNILKNNENIIKVSNNKYDLLCGLFECPEKYEEFILRVKIILLGGAQSIQSIDEKLNQLRVDKIERCSLESILGSSKMFKSKDGIYQNNKINSELKNYDKFMQKVIKAGMKEKEIRFSLKWNSCKKIFLKYLPMDPRVIIESGNGPESRTNKSTELDSILDEFDF
jgi:RNA polymerase primary sigma factor